MIRARGIRTVYAAAGAARPALKRVTLASLDALKASRKQIVVLTAADAPTAGAADDAGADVLLVGDSLGMTSLGLASTVGVTLADMEAACAAVTRGSSGRPLLVADLPFASYSTESDALASAARLFARGGAAAVKLEGGAAQAHKVSALAREGFPVWGHVGLLPQTAALGGSFALAGRGREESCAVVADALALEAAGARAVVLECVPTIVARFLRDRLRIPTIGIGAGADCDGQVLVAADVLGLLARTPSFARRYAELGASSREAFRAFANDVRSGAFPATEHAKNVTEKDAHEFWDAAIARFGEARTAAPAARLTAAVTAAPALPASSAAHDVPLFAASMKKDPMRIAVVGSGAIASLVAAALSTAADVTVFSSWGDRVADVCAKRGISWTANGARGVARVDAVDVSAWLPILRVRPTFAIPSPRGEPAGAAAIVGSFDAVLIAAKAPAVASVAPLAWALAAQDAPIIPLFNGAYSYEYLCAWPRAYASSLEREPVSALGTAAATMWAHAAKAGPRARVAYGLVTAGATLARADGGGQTVHLCGDGDVHIFEPPRDSGDGCDATVVTFLINACMRAPDSPLLSNGVVFRAGYGEWRAARAAKLSVNAILNPLAALLGCSNGNVAEASSRGGAARATAEALARDAFAALSVSPSGRPWEEASAQHGWRGVRDAEDLLEKALGAARSTSPNINSMLADARAARLSEVDFVSGAVLRALPASGAGRATRAVVEAQHARERALGVRDDGVDANVEAIISLATRAS